MNGELRKKLEEMPGVHVREEGDALIAEPLSDHDVARVLTALKWSDGKVQLSLARMEKLGAFDEKSLLVSAAAGVPLSTLESAANRVGLSLGAISAGALRLRVGEFLEGPYAALRAVPGGRLETMVAALRVVSPDGLITDSRPQLRGGEGPDLHALHVGAERRFGVIVNATLKLVPLRKTQQRASFSFPSAAALTETLQSAMQDGVLLSSAVLERRASEAGARYLLTAELQGTVESLERDLSALSRRAAHAHGRGAAGAEQQPSEPEAFATFEELRAALEAGKGFHAARLSVVGAVVSGVELGTPLRWGQGTELYGVDALSRELDLGAVMQGVR